MQSSSFALRTSRLRVSVRRPMPALVLMVLAVSCRPERPETQPSEQCESVGPRRPVASGADLCTACAEGEALCATDPHLLASGYRIGEPDVAWTGAEIGVAWDAMPDVDSHPGIRFARVSPLSDVLHQAILSRSMGETSPHVTWTGSEFGVTWGPPTFFDPVPPPDTPDDTIVAIVGSDGILKSPEHRGLKLGLKDGGKLAWSGAEYAVAWWDGSWLWLSRASATGERIGDDRLLSQGAADASIVWNGNLFAAAWGELSPFLGGGVPRTSSLRLLELSPSGSGTEPPTIDGPLERPNPSSIEVHSLVWTGDDYALLWSEANDLYPHALYLARIAPGTAKVSAMTMVSEANGVSWEPSLVWTGARFVVAWPEYTAQFRQDLFVGSYSPGLERIGGPLQLSAGTGKTYSTFSTTPALAVANDLVLVVWSSTDESMIRCPPSTEVLAFAQVAACL